MFRTVVQLHNMVQLLIVMTDENGKETFQSKMKNMASQNHVAKCKYNLISCLVKLIYMFGTVVQLHNRVQLLMVMRMGRRLSNQK